MRQTIKRDRLRYALRMAKQTKAELKNLSLVSISVALPIGTKPLAAGFDHAAVARALETLGVPEGTWEIQEVKFWR
jgi:hypothetical protein